MSDTGITSPTSDPASAALLRHVLQGMSDQIAGRSSTSLMPGEEFLPTATAEPTLAPQAPTTAAPKATPRAPRPAAASMTVTAGGDVGALMRAMSGGVESHGDPNVTNARTGAHGAWQVMPSNWAPWAKEAGVDPGDQSLANQQRVVAHKMQQYLDTFGSIDAVAVAWYAGPAAAAAWLKNPNAPRFNKPPAKGEPSVNDYVNRIRAAIGAQQ